MATKFPTFKDFEEKYLTENPWKQKKEIKSIQADARITRYNVDGQDFYVTHEFLASLPKDFSIEEVIRNQFRNRMITFPKRPSIQSIREVEPVAYTEVTTVPIRDPENGRLVGSLNIEDAERWTLEKTGGVLYHSIKSGFWALGSPATISSYEVRPVKKAEARSLLVANRHYVAANREFGNVEDEFIDPAYIESEPTPPVG